MTYQDIEGIPLGESLFFLLVFGQALIGSFLIVFTKRFRWGGLGLIAASTLFVAGVLVEPDININTMVPPEYMVGVWGNESCRLILKSDGEYMLLEGNTKFEGSWDIDDWNLPLRPHPPDIYPRIIRVDSEIRIAMRFRSIDTWDGDLGLVKLK